MRHKNAFRKFSMTAAHRRSMLRNLASSLLEHGHFETTYPRAKELQRVTEKLITLAREDSLAARRQALSYLKSKAVVTKLFKEIGPQFRARTGGYTRVLKTRNRHGDAASMAFIELVKDTDQVETSGSGKAEVAAA